MSQNLPNKLRIYLIRKMTTTTQKTTVAVKMAQTAINSKFKNIKKSHQTSLQIKKVSAKNSNHKDDARHTKILATLKNSMKSINQEMVTVIKKSIRLLERLQKRAGSPYKRKMESKPII